MFLTGRSDAVRPSPRVLAQGMVIGKTAIPPGNDAISHRAYGFNTTIVVPLLSPSGSWLAVGVYV